MTLVDRHRWVVAATALAAGWVAAPEPAFAARTTMTFRIPAQPVPAAMAQFARQSGVQILFPYDQVRGLKTCAIDGRMTPEMALTLMIKGTGLRVSRAGANALALSTPTRPAPVARTVPKPVSAGLISPTSALEPTRARSLALAAAPQDSPAPGAAAPPQDDGRSDIVVTGSRGLQRTVADSPTPIDVISGAELQRTGKPGVLAALNTLVPSFNVPTRAGGGTSTVISTGGLRGLNPDQTLILVNGKRRHKTSLINAVSSLYNGSVPADLDMIPTSAVDHIEVLRDGAAAQYGSDAIAGVINIILKDAVNGGSASFTAGQNMDRSDGENYLGEANLGVALGAKGFADFFVSAKKQRSSNRAIPIASSVRLYNLVNGQPDPREATADRLVTKNYGAFPTEGINTGYNAGYNFGDVEVYSFGTYSQRNSQLDFTFRAPNNAASLPEVYPNGFRPRLNIHEEDFEFALGARGTLSGWKWDLSSTYGKNRSWQNASKTINASLGPTSPTDFYVGSLISSEWVNSLDVTRGFDIGGNLQVSAGLQHRRETYAVLRGDPYSYAAGTYTYVVNGTVIRPAPGAQAAAGFQPADEGHIARSNLSAYLDLTYDPTPRTTIGAAVRYEHFDDASGDTVIGKATIRQALTPWLAVRGAVNNGFRAPGLAQQIYASTTGQFRIVNNQLNLLQIKTLPVGSPAAIALGAKPLKPEKSLNFSAGLVLTPLRNLSVTVDAYQIKVDDRIAITSTLTGTAVSNILIANGLSGDISAQYYTNAIDTRTRGIDVVATYRHTIGSFAKMSWNIGYNYNKTVITGIAPNPTQLSSLGANYVLFDRLSQSNLTDNLPRTKLFIGNVTTIGPITFSGRLVRYGGFWSKQNSTGKDAGGNPLFANDRYFGGKWVTDAEIGWQVTKGVNLAVGANNLFNVYPDANGIYNANLGSGQYPTTGGYGFTGGYYYGRIRVTF